ncbi:ImmA/IrrE family metallo-endopeptidase [Candidatus Dojkabacteria bacterium]|nr:ImmA/IrrE family metallo-endopeptidase [Candidatus Dojkabacteria bacterium]
MDPRKIEEKAEAVIGSTFPEDEDLTLPISLSEILKKYSFKVKYVTFDQDKIKKLLGSSSKNIVAALLEKTIFISKLLSAVDQKLAIAHELGNHFANDLESVLTSKKDLRVNDSQDTKPEIITANLFATALLMPKDLVIGIWQDAGNISLMSQLFLVDESVMLWRLYNLGVIYDPIKKLTK